MTHTSDLATMTGQSQFTMEGCLPRFPLGELFDTSGPFIVPAPSKALREKVLAMLTEHGCFMRDRRETNSEIWRELKPRQFQYVGYIGDVYNSAVFSMYRSYPSGSEGAGIHQKYNQFTIKFAEDASGSVEFHLTEESAHRQERYPFWSFESLDEISQRLGHKLEDNARLSAAKSVESMERFCKEREALKMLPRSAPTSEAMIIPKEPFAVPMPSSETLQQVKALLAKEGCFIPTSGSNFKVRGAVLQSELRLGQFQYFGHQEDLELGKFGMVQCIAMAFGESTIEHRETLTIQFAKAGSGAIKFYLTQPYYGEKESVEKLWTFDSLSDLAQQLGHLPEDNLRMTAKRGREDGFGKPLQVTDSSTEQKASSTEHKA